MKQLLFFQSPLDSYSGYGAHARDIAAALLTLEDYDVKFILTPWGNTPNGALQEPQWKHLASHTVSGNLNRPDVYIQLTIPNEFQPIGVYNIGITAGIETTICNSEWLIGCNRMNLVITTSAHSKHVFKSTTYDKIDNNTKKVIETLQIVTPIEVLFEGCDTSIYKEIPKASIEPTISEFMSTIPEKFVFLCVGHWLQGGLGADRKDIGMLIKTFCETFKHAAIKPALLLKTSGATTSLIDRYDIMNKIYNTTRIYGDDAPSIYLLHGSLTDTEINSLYNHNKVKAFVTFTHGEGFGRPLLEFSMTGKPIIAPNWSGQLDFLSKNFTTLLPGQLTPVDGSAVNDWVVKDALWYTVDYPYAARIMQHMYTNYDVYLAKAVSQRKYANANFTKELMESKLRMIINSYVPKKQEIIMPKINLPKINKAV